LAPDVYLGVLNVVDEDGRPCDHLVAMRRMPDDRRLSTLVRAGADVSDELRAIAHVVATFHASARRSSEIDDAGGAKALWARWDDNFEGLEPLTRALFAPADVDRLHNLADHYIDGRRTLIEQRVEQGHIRDGHGDLLADDIFCLPDGPRVLDCLEFDDHLRWLDVLDDVCFLAMDLERLGRADLAERFLANWRELTGDAFPASLADHYIAYRALVRAKVTGLRWAQGDETAEAPARALLELAVRHAERGRVRLVLIGGSPGTGKSTVAAAVAERTGWVMLRSDALRKEQAGLDARAPAPAALYEGLYTAARTEAMYGELLARAEQALTLGESVVLDASWLDPRWREEARRVAERTASDLVALRCTVDDATADVRIVARHAGAANASDATPAIAAARRAIAAPWPSAHMLDTSAPVSATVAAALAHVD
jgi:aminoglycoside phosphotransferase family enzyme/predicted kinase